jgi:hypothetical protein
VSASTRLARAFALVVALASLGCGRPFHVTTPPGFLELHGEEVPFAYRAITPEGVVAAIRVVDLEDDSGGLPFWSRAVTVRMREIDGYALLGESEVRSADGTAGRELRFGRDQGGKPYLYTVRLYVAQSRLFVVETGGPSREVERYQPSLHWMQHTVKVRCGGFLAPVLSSHTCNRW